jgi:hypothetical protein
VRCAMRSVGQPRPPVHVRLHLLGEGEDVEEKLGRRHFGILQQHVRCGGRVADDAAHMVRLGGGQKIARA